jgi:hypothetical protein
MKLLNEKYLHFIARIVLYCLVIQLIHMYYIQIDEDKLLLIIAGLVIVEMIILHIYIRFEFNELWHECYRLSQSQNERGSKSEGKVVEPSSKSRSFDSEDKIGQDLENLKSSVIEMRGEMTSIKERIDGLLLRKNQEEKPQQSMLQQFLADYHSGEYVEDKYPFKCYKPKDERYERDERENDYVECGKDTEGLFIFHLDGKYVLIPSFHNRLTDQVVKISGLRKFYDVPDQLMGRSGARIKSLAYVKGFVQQRGSLELMGSKGKLEA